MKKFIIETEEKERILKMHETATKNLYLLKETVEQDMSKSLDNLEKVKKDWQSYFSVGWGGSPNKLYIQPKISKDEQKVYYQLGLPLGATLVGFTKIKGWTTPQFEMSFGSLDGLVPLVGFSGIFKFIQRSYEDGGIQFQFYNKKNTRLTHEQSYDLWDNKSKKEIANTLGYENLNDAKIRLGFKMGDSAKIIPILQDLEKTGWKSFNKVVNLVIKDLKISATRV